MIPSPVGALDWCHIWNHIFLTRCFNFATLVCIWRLQTTFLWFIGMQKIIVTWWKNCCLVLKTLRGNARNIDFVLVSSSAPLFLSRSLSFFAELFNLLEQRTLKLSSPLSLTTVPFFIFPCLFVVHDFKIIFQKQARICFKQESFI